MAVTYIDVGAIANDGTGDDLREAFIKVNQNFEELDLRDDERTTASNLGIGVGVFAQKINYDLQFKSIFAGNLLTTSVTDESILIEAETPEVQFTSDSGDVTISHKENLTITGGNGIDTSITGNVLTVENTFPQLFADKTPRLGGELNADNKSISNVKILTVERVVGEHFGPVIGDVEGNLTGQVFGNATTASRLENARLIQLTGDLTGSASFDGSSNITINTTVDINSITLGQDTTGDYVQSLLQGNGISISDFDGEGSTPTISLADDFTVRDIIVRNITSTGIGTYSTVNTGTVNAGAAELGNLNVGDGYISLNSTQVGSPFLFGGIEIVRGDDPSAFLQWNETRDRWQFIGGPVRADNFIGTVEGVNINDIYDPYFKPTSFDFLSINPNISTHIDWLIWSVDVDFGSFTSPDDRTVDFGSF
jgi:hypothetical protein